MATATRNSFKGRRALLLALAVATTPAVAVAAPRPFTQGEVLSYEVSLGRFGSGGTGRLQVGHGEPLRGEPVVVLAFDFKTKVGPFSVSHRSRSWLSTRRMASLRYVLHEKAPFNNAREEVDVYPDEKRWRGREGAGDITTELPLDELSYLYLLRTLPLADGTLLELNRHFDVRRNPAVVRVLRRESVRVPAGDFEAVLVEMTVHDPNRLGGQGVMRLHLSDDARRLMLRIESEVPVVGRLVLELSSASLASEDTPD